MGSIHEWKAGLYDDKLGFVSQYGRGILEILNVQQGETVLDLGCGTGDLSHEIAQQGASVIGMDLSEEMMDRARTKYPDIHFISGNAENFTLDEPVDAVFSNAALHWVKNAEGVISSVWHALGKGGRFVAEFGGRGNVEMIVKSITDVLSQDYGVDANELNPWYFPSIGEYTQLLEQQGFRVTYAVHFDRPTQLEDGKNGLKHWLNGLAADVFFKDISESDKKDIFTKIATHASESLFDGESWIADYKRLRVVAFK
ncbi:class I SAM-dependent methyltransferase [Paenibacillus antarcticus]|uniref:Methyltransferase type 11 n=1 Tax=Paenibacillus antarcticus TaxID=253703 RepID=A0A168PSV5_9BACL|nr:class I SAM-dependent methyltransferase [Paenibacillus antarcticus]OAB47040.1 methyltransferase type 11 [Paenibacillus antarcticus]